MSFGSWPHGRHNSAAIPVFTGKNASLLSRHSRFSLFPRALGKHLACSEAIPQATARFRKLQRGFLTQVGLKVAA